MTIKIEVSARHTHLTKEDINKLFGEDYDLQELRNLSQGDNFAAKETVVLKTDQEEFKLRVVGPARDYSQIELSFADAIALGIDAPLRVSGHLEDVPSYEIEGPAGKTKVPVIIAKRHIHLSEAKAQELGIQEGDQVKVKIDGERGLIFDNVIVRTDEEYSLFCHLDTDEGNACGIKDFGEGELII